MGRSKSLLDPVDREILNAVRVETATGLIDWLAGTSPRKVILRRSGGREITVVERATLAAAQPFVERGQISLLVRHLDGRITYTAERPA
jgi:hypothetical protein